MCPTRVKEDGSYTWEYCGPGCPSEDDAWKTDDTLKVTHGVDQKEIMVALKLHGILASSLLLIGLMVTGLGMSVSEMFKKNLNSFSAMMISNTLKNPQDKNEIMDLSMIQKFLKILSVLMIIFSIMFFACFGCFLVLNDDSIAQTVTLSSEGAANETYPDSMGEYHSIENDGVGSLTVYRHVEREDRFLLYNKFGNI